MIGLIIVLLIIFIGSGIVYVYKDEILAKLSPSTNTGTGGTNTGTGGTNTGTGGTNTGTGGTNTGETNTGTGGTNTGTWGDWKISSGCDADGNSTYIRTCSGTCVGDTTKKEQCLDTEEGYYQIGKVKVCYGSGLISMGQETTITLPIEYSSVDSMYPIVNLTFKTVNGISPISVTPADTDKIKIYNGNTPSGTFTYHVFGW